ncbi:MAG: hypothetical protein CSB55_03375 [Candidatus Cloacimonadota bacterium]|nr:MAG: hypothetical protein CSB55_03375 [Candidatus Cloacimonadota bacterium]
MKTVKIFIQFERFSCFIIFPCKIILTAYCIAQRNFAGNSVYDVSQKNKRNKTDSATMTNTHLRTGKLNNKLIFKSLVFCSPEKSINL